MPVFNQNSQKKNWNFSLFFQKLDIVKSWGFCTAFSASGPFFWAIKTYFVTILLGKEDGRVVGQHAALGYRHAGQQMFDPGGGLEVPGCLPANDAELLVVPG